MTTSTRTWETRGRILRDHDADAAQPTVWRELKMTEPNRTEAQTQDVGWTEPLYEAGAAITLKVNYRGHDVMLTIRDHSGQSVLAKLDGAIDHLEKSGAIPTTVQSNNQTVDAGDDTPPVCNVHNRPMKRSQYDGWYCTAKLADGSYCDQKH